MSDECLDAGKTKAAARSAWHRLARIYAITFLAAFAPFAAPAFADMLKILMADALVRGGATASVLALTASFMLNEYRDDFEGRSYADKYKSCAFSKYENWYKSCYVVCISAAICGGVLWGFGDLIPWLFTSPPT